MAKDQECALEDLVATFCGVRLLVALPPAIMPAPNTRLCCSGRLTSRAQSVVSTMGGVLQLATQ